MVRSLSPDVADKKRPATSGDVADRDTFTRKTPSTAIAAQLATPEFVEEDCTGKYEGEELAAHRAKRPTPMRLGHVEERVDGVVASIGELRADVANELASVKTKVAEELGSVKEKFGELSGEFSGLKTVILDGRAREHSKFKATLEVDTAEQIADVKIREAKDIDKVAARKAKRELWLKVIGIAIAGGGVFEVIKALLMKLGVL
jgi:hypothetical protein